MADPQLDALAARVGQALAVRGLSMASAESCTGGWISAAVTAVAGSSGWFERGYVTYSNAAKVEDLGVDPAVIQARGAVSEAVVLAMVDGALRRSGAGLAVAVSGVAGPGGGTPAKPVGTVCLAWGLADGTRVCGTWHFPGDREAVRRCSVAEALEGVLRLLEAPAAA